jgi:hypothetical protein
MGRTVNVMSQETFSVRNNAHVSLSCIKHHDRHGSGQSKLETFWKAFTIPENIRDSWEVNILTLTGVRKKLIAVLLDDWGVQTASHAAEKSFVKGRLNRFGKLHCCLILRNWHTHPNLQQPDQSAAINIEARPSISKKITTRWKLRWWLAFLAIKLFLIKICTIFRHNIIAHLTDHRIP